MKINNKTRAAIAAKNNPQTKPALRAKKPGVLAKVAKAAKAKVTRAVALLSGERGFCARSVEVHTSTEGVSIRALQDNKGLAIVGELAPIIAGKLTSKAKRDARVQLGGYVNGRNTGARVELITPEQFKSRSKDCIVHWSADDSGIRGRYIGNPNEKGMCAVSVEYRGATYYWQMEQDSNANNKHERGLLKPLTKEGRLLATK